MRILLFAFCVVTADSPLVAQRLTARDSAEIAVIRVLLGQVIGDSSVAIVPTTTAFLVCAIERVDVCIRDTTAVRYVRELPDSTKTHLYEAAQDLQRRREADENLHRLLMQQARASTALAPSIPPDATCGDRRRVEVTRVGLDATMSHAIVAYVSYGPATGRTFCSVQSNASLLRRRTDGSWEVIGAISGVRAGAPAA